MSSAGTDITIVIPVRNDATRLRRCLETIAANRHAARVAVVVADNGSTDDSAAVASAAGATVLALPQDRVGELRNRAAKETSSRLIAFVDADHLVDPGWVAAALEILSDPTVGATGAPYSQAPNANWVQRAYHRFRPTLTQQEPAEWLGSGNLIVRRTAFEQIGGFDASLQSCEDVDLCNRLRAAGHRLVADPRLRSIHLGDPSSLRALFFGELWRGRDNIRVTLRGPVTLRALPSVAIPIVNLACLALLATVAWTGSAIAILAGVIFASFTLLRAAKMSSRAGLAVRDVAGNIVVAAVYDLARALSLVTRATHRTRREAAGERAVA